MDPAGPYFENVDPMVRLDPTDAVFVDAIHSDSDPIVNLGKLLQFPCWNLMTIFARGSLYDTSSLGGSKIRDPVPAKFRQVTNIVTCTL